MANSLPHFDLTYILPSSGAVLAQDLSRKGYLSRCIGLKLRYDDFFTITREQSLKVPTREASVVLDAARTNLRRVPLDRKLRLLGLRAGGLVKEDGFQSQGSRTECDTPALFPDWES